LKNYYNTPESGINRKIFAWNIQEDLIPECIRRAFESEMPGKIVLLKFQSRLLTGTGL